MKTIVCLSGRLALKLLLPVLITLYGLPHLQAQTPVLQAGFSKKDITPPQPGYPHYRGTSTGTDDSLYARTFVLKQGKTESALMVCDLLWISRELSADVRQKASALTGIPASNIIISATHSHTSPAYDQNIKILNEGLRKKDAYTLDPDPYPAWLAGQMIGAIVEAYKSAVPVRVKSGKTVVEGISYNRRFIMKDGKVVTNPGVGNKDILRTTGPNDPDLGILIFERTADQVPIGTFSNFAVHADTYGSTRFSADYPGVIAAVLERKFGNGFVSVFGAGPCGNLNHVNVAAGSKRPTTAEIGEKLAGKLLTGLPSLKPLTAQSLRFLSDYAYVPLQQYTREDLEYVSRPEQSVYNDKIPLLARRRKVKIESLEEMRRTEAIPPTIGTEPWILPLEVQVLTLGKEVAIVGLPGELFVELGLEIKKKSPYRHTMVVELTNVHIAYVPTLEGFRQGGYEAVNSRLQPGGGEMLVDAALKLLNQSFPAR